MTAARMPTVAVDSPSEVVWRSFSRDRKLCARWRNRALSLGWSGSRLGEELREGLLSLSSGLSLSCLSWFADKVDWRWVAFQVLSHE